MDRSLEVRLERLRASRVRGDGSSALGPLVREAARELERCARRLGGAGGAWAEVCPAELAERTAVEGLSRGVLTVRVRDASARYEVDRWLRSGGEAALVRASAAPIRRVKLVTG